MGTASRPRRRVAGARRVVAPDGRRWKVGREWRPRRIRLHRRRPDLDSVADIPIADDLGAIGLILVIVALIVLLVTVVWPLLAVAVELVLLVMLFLAGTAARVAAIQPWRVIARSDEPYAERRSWQVKGWRASREVIEEVATAIEAGREPRPAGHGALERGD